MCKAHSNTERLRGKIFLLFVYIFCVLYSTRRRRRQQFLSFFVDSHTTKVYISLSGFLMPYMPFVMSPKTTFTIISSRLHIFYTRLTHSLPPFLKLRHFRSWNDFKGRNFNILMTWRFFCSPRLLCGTMKNFNLLRNIF